MDQEQIILSGGPLEEPVAAEGWAAGEEKEFTVGSWIYSYRRLPPDEEGHVPLMAVYTGRKRVT